MQTDSTEQIEFQVDGEDADFNVNPERIKQALESLLIVASKEKPPACIKFWLVLKHFDLTPDRKAVTDTKNIESDTEELFEIEEIDNYIEEDDKITHYDPFVAQAYKHNCERSVIHTNLKNIAEGKSGFGGADPSDWLRIEQDDNDNLHTAYTEYWDEYIGKGVDGFAPEGENLRIPLVDLMAWYYRDEGFNKKFSYDALKKQFKMRFNLNDTEIAILFEEPEDKEMAMDNFYTDSGMDMDAVAEYAAELAKNGRDTEAAERRPASIDDETRQTLRKASEPVVGDYYNPTELTPRESAKKALDRGNRAILLHGPPGTGKTHLAEQLAKEHGESHVEMTINPDASREDMIEAEVPEGDELSFETEKGVLRWAADEARDTDGLYFLIANEINHANVRRTMADAFDLIDERREDMNTITLTTGDDFSLPENLVIIATMNRQDWSTNGVDASFYRRVFDITMPPRADKIPEVVDEDISPPEIKQIQALLHKVNEISDKPLGHTYFRHLQGGLDDLNFVYQYRIRSQFRNYYWNRDRETLKEIDRLFEKAADGELI